MPMVEKKYIYDPELIERAEKLTTTSAQVTNKDLVAGVGDKGKKQRNKKINDLEKGNLSGMKWDKYKDDDEKDRIESRNNLAALTTMQSINNQKNLDNNAIFFNENEEEQMQLKIMALKIKARDGIKSEAIYGMEKKAHKVYQKDRVNYLLNLDKKCTVDRHTLDGIRKVLQLASTEKKIDKWIYQDKLPNLYPRAIDEIKEWPTNPLVMQERKRLAYE